jgi:ribonuclease BN (tRNA processing enzyme)
VIDLVVLGAGPAYTDRPGATGSAYLLRHGDTRILLDLGQGSFPRIFPEVAPESLDGILISHLHPDHFIDLVSLRHYLRYHFETPKRVRVVGPRDLAGRIDALHAEPGFSAQSLDVEAFDGAVVRLGELTVEARRVTHTDDSYGMRVSAGSGPGLVYSGDCGRADDLLPLLRPGDTLLSEVSFGPGPVPQGAIHLDGPEVGRVAREAGASSVLLTHLQMWLDPDATVAAVRAEFSGTVTMVWPGTRVTIG